MHDYYAKYNIGKPLAEQCHITGRRFIRFGLDKNSNPIAIPTKARERKVENKGTEEARKSYSRQIYMYEPTEDWPFEFTKSSISKARLVKALAFAEKYKNAGVFYIKISKIKSSLSNASGIMGIYLNDLLIIRHQNLFNTRMFKGFEINLEGYEFLKKHRDKFEK